MSDQGYCTGEMENSQRNFEEIFDKAISSDSNICFYGPTGTGKTEMLMRLYTELSKDKRARITSTTARGTVRFREVLGKGKTFTRTTGVGDIEIEHIVAAMDYLANDIPEIDILLFDDFSLINSLHFEKIHRRFCEKRNEFSKPFGGVRLIMAGDAYMVTPDEKKRLFCSQIWDECAFVTYELTYPFRYDTGSKHWFDTLQRIRCGKAEDSDLEKIEKLVADKDVVDQRLQEYWKDYETHGTTEFIMYICTRRDEVTSHNKEQLQKIKNSEIVALIAYDEVSGSMSEIAELTKKLDKEIERIIELKIGATVVTTRNQSNIITSGVVGIVKKINKDVVTIFVNSSKEEIEIVRCSHDVEVEGETEKYSAKRVQFPIRLGYATTMQKVLGVEFENAVITLNEPWLDGYFYTALSRVKNYKNITIILGPKSCIWSFIKQCQANGQAFDELLKKKLTNSSLREEVTASNVTEEWKKAYPLV